MYSDKGEKKTIFKSLFKSTMFHLYLEKTQGKKVVYYPKVSENNNKWKESIT